MLTTRPHTPPWNILKPDKYKSYFAALSLTFIRGHKSSPVFHADRVIIGLPCSQGQPFRIWKVQFDWAKSGKRRLFSVEQAFVGRDDQYGEPS